MSARLLRALAATYDRDVVYARTPENLRRLVDALGPLAPNLRGAPRGLPFQWDRATLERGLNFTLITSAVDLELLGESVGRGGYEQRLDLSSAETLFDVECLA